MTRDKQIRVLAVFEEPDTQEQICSVLRGYGFRVEAVSEGSEGLMRLKRLPVDVIVSNVHLPGMSGIQLAQAARRIHPQVQVIMVIYEDDAESIPPALAAGVANIVCWPCAPEQMCATVERAMHTLKTNTRRLIEDRTGVLYKLVGAFAAAVDAKSYYTYRHSARVTELCNKLAPVMRLSDEEAAMFEIAAMVHDIGKIGTPDLVLAKPDALSDEEWVDVLKHPDLGSSILAQVEELAEVAAIVRHHHERVDGTGYPDGLVGEAIPRLARALSVVDAYEAMTSERPYRRALSHNDAINELLKGRRSQFDAEIAEIFVDAISGAEEELKQAA